MVPDSLLSVFDEYELEVSRMDIDKKYTEKCW